MTYTKTVTVKEGITLTLELSYYHEDGNVFADSFEKIELIWNGTMNLKGTEVEFPIHYYHVARKGEENITTSQEIKNVLDQNKNIDMISYFQVDFKGQKTLIQLANVDLEEIIKTVKNELIEEMHEDGVGEEEKTTSQIEKEKAEKEIRIAKELVAKVENTEKLMTEREKEDYLNKYNKIMNEGGEGYIPYIITKEQYESALKLIGKEN